MNKFRNDEGLTLIELLITLAVIAIVFAIAVPVFSNVLAGAQSSADSAQAAALASFHDEYASTDLVYANGVTTATLNGVQIASIKGDATSGSTGGGSTPVAPAVTFTSANGDFGFYSMYGMNMSSSTGGGAGLTFGSPSAALKSALSGLAAGANVTVNGVVYQTRANNGVVYSDNGASAILWVFGQTTYAPLESFTVGGTVAAGAPAFYNVGSAFTGGNVQMSYAAGVGSTLTMTVTSADLKAKLEALTTGSTIKVAATQNMGGSYVGNDYTVGTVTVSGNDVSITLPSNTNNLTVTALYI
jgi:prepilin-type N-terminal cleavage/methylation domain-containing protein